MNYVIPKCHLKTFHKALISLSKVGGEIYFEPCQDKLLAKAINNRKTAFFVFCFKAGFFSTIDGKIQQNDDNPFRCKLQLKSILLAFHSVVNTEKSVESCLIQFKQDSYQVFITRNCRYQVCQKYTLPTLEHDTLKIDFNQSGSNHWTITSKLLSETTAIFRNNLDEIIMTATSEGLQIRSYVYSHEEKDQVNTCVSIEAESCDEYHIEHTTTLTFNLKELRSMMSFAETVSLPVKAVFSDGGRPIAFTIDQEPILQVSYVLATMPDENSETIRLMTTPAPKAPMSRVGRGNKTTAKVQRHSTQNKSLRGGDIGSMPQPSLTPIARPLVTVVDTDNSQHDDRNDENEENVDENTSRIIQARKRKSHVIDTESIEHSIVESPTIDNTAAKKRPRLFDKCFEKTFNPTMLHPGTRILAPDSDEENLDS